MSYELGSCVQTLQIFSLRVVTGPRRVPQRIAVDMQHRVQIRTDHVPSSDGKPSYVLRGGGYGPSKVVLGVKTWVYGL